MGKYREQDGDWLCPPGNYRHLVHSLCSADPRLRRRDPKAIRHGIAWSSTALSGRVVLLETTGATSVASNFTQRAIYTSAQDLHAHLQARSAGAGAGAGADADTPARVYILEGQNPSFIDVLGDYFGMHPSMFVEHERVEVIAASADRECDAMLLPTISVERVIITDPPLQVVSRDKQLYHGISAPPFRGGYPDFVPQQEQIRARMGPPRTSMLDDLSFYLTHHAHLLDTSEPSCVTLFAQKIATSHYHQLIYFLHSVVSSIQWPMSRHDDLDRFHVSAVESQWSDVQALERRLSEYSEDFEAAMMQLRVPLRDVVEPDAMTSWQDSRIDLQVLYMKLQGLRHRVEVLNSAITALAGMAGNRQALKEQDRALKEAKSTKALTFVGLVFIPLAYTASLFSMAAPYGLGQDKFWLYFAVATPLIVLVVFIYYAVELTTQITSSGMGKSREI